MKRHHVLIVGAGSIGERHLRCFAATGRARVGFVEVQPALREQIAGKYPDARAYGSLESALDHPFDAAVVATPAPLHVAQARQLIERGMSVLIEKPLSIGMDGCDALLAACKRRGVVAGVAYVHRANPVIAEMRKAIVSGEFGRPVELVAVGGQYFPSIARPIARPITLVTKPAAGRCRMR